MSKCEKEILEILKYPVKQITLAIDGFAELVRKQKMKQKHMKAKPRDPSGLGPRNMWQPSNLKE